MIMNDINDIINLLINLSLKLIDLTKWCYDFLITEHDLGRFGSFSGLEILGGGGLTVLIIAGIIKKVTPLL